MLIPVLVVTDRKHVLRVESCNTPEEAELKLRAALKDPTKNGTVYHISDPTYLEIKVGDPVKFDGSDEFDFHGNDAKVKGGPGSGRHPYGRHGLLKSTADLIDRKAAGEGHEVGVTADQLKDILNKGTYAIMSAGRNPADPSDMKLTDAQIAARGEQMISDLKTAGYAYTPVEGHYGNPESSIMVYEATRPEAIDMGKQYHQDSVIYSAAQQNAFIYTTGENAGKAQTGTGYSDQSAAKDMYTQVTHPDGSSTKFQLNIDFNTPAK